MSSTTLNTSPTMVPNGHHPDEPVDGGLTYENSLPSSESTTDTSPSPSGTTMTLPFRPRNRSPYSRNQSRPQTPVNSLSAPTMIRAHSSPVMGTSGRFSASATPARSSSPLGSYRRYHSPSRRLADESCISFGGQTLTGIGETVFEEDEDEEGATSKDLHIPPTPPSYQSNSFPRRQRPVSPLYQAVNPSTFVPAHGSSRSVGSSPILSVTKYNESYPSSSSMPSTPTSMRSRSPSISSLETIPDSPDAEAAELEAERIAKLKAAADAADAAAAGALLESSPDVRRRSYVDVTQARGRSGASLPGSLSSGSVFSIRDKRKRWSVCGAERRGDLDLETIWED